MPLIIFKGGATVIVRWILTAGCLIAFSGCYSAETCGPVCGPKDESPRVVPYSPGRTIATLANRRIAESSGLAYSRLHEDVFWTHNDSGDAPRIYAFGIDGEDLGTFTIAGARNDDWEDMGSFTGDANRSFLLIGDVGDNAGSRKGCTLYLVGEPQRLPGKPALRKCAAAMTISFAYEGGPRDCEALAVDPTGRKILLVTKSLLPLCEVYELPLPSAQPQETLIAKPIAVIGISLVSGMDISPDGLRAVICNYGEAFEYSRREGEQWSAAFARPPRRIPLPPRRQGESICYGRDAVTLYLTSEKLPTPLLEVSGATCPPE